MSLLLCLHPSTPKSRVMGYQINVLPLKLVYDIINILLRTC